jgi:hypothetical protein
MDVVRRGLLFILGAYLLIYALTVDAVQLGVLIAALLLMGVITWDQITMTFGRDGHDDHEDHEDKE